MSNTDIVANNIANVNIVANDIANIDTLVSNLSNINSVYSNNSNISTVASGIGNVATVSNNISSINAVNTNLTAIGSVVAGLSNINTVSSSISNINTVASVAPSLSTVITAIPSITAVAPITSDVTTVAGISSNVTTVAGISSSVASVATNSTNINTVGLNIGNVNYVGSNISNVNSVANNMLNINAVLGISTSITTVASNIIAVQNANANAISAQNSATSAASSASTATTQASLSSASQLSASSSASLAAGYAASASSVVQQDLSAVSAGLHRSPNAITAMYIYDTSKDSDGGAWTEKCQHTSWYNEPLAGNWLGQAGNESVARAVGATLGSEIVSNGTFTTDTTGWTVTSGVSVVNGQLNLVTSSTTDVTCRQALTTVVNTQYLLTFNKVSGAGTSTDLYLLVGTSIGGSQLLLVSAIGNNAAQTYSYVFTATTTTTYIQFDNRTDVASTVILDNVSVKPITATNTNSNDYFQLTTDGKFYRLYKNLASYSEEFDNSYWVKTELTVTANATTAPDSTTTADLLIPSTNSVTHQVGKAILGSAPSIQCTTSVYLKASGYNYAAFQLNDALSAVGIDLSLGTITYTGTSIQSATITSVGNSWYRVSITSTTATLGNHRYAYIIPLSTSMTTSTVPTYAGNGTSGVYVWGLQLEYGSSLTTYEKKVADGSTGEIFRGNKAKFPKVAAIIAEIEGITIYDLTEPGRPMWMRFGTNPSDAVLCFLSNKGATITSISMLNGIMAVGKNSGIAFYGHLRVANFAGDWMHKFTGYYATNYRSQATISLRNSNVVGFSLTNDISLGGVVNTMYSGNIGTSGSVNAVAMTTLPDAPIDPVSGLKVPTIAVATGGGVSVIKHNSTIVSMTGYSPTSLGGSVSISGKTVIASRAAGSNAKFKSIGNEYYASYGSNGNDYWGLALLTDPSNTATSYGGSAFAQGGSSNNYGFPYILLNKINRKDANPLSINSNLNIRTNGITSSITSTYNTGHMLGDIRRVYLSDSIVGSVTVAELVTNGNFDADVAGWTGATWNSGVARGTNTGTWAYISQTVATVIGVSYVITADVISTTAGNVWVEGGVYTNTFPYVGIAAGGKIRAYFVATSATTVVRFSSSSNTNGSYYEIDNVSVKTCGVDRSYKSNAATVYGTLTKSLSATNNQLVAYSGFSAANYLQEPYSSDLDFGTGDWSVGAWVNIPTTLPVSSFPLLSSELVDTANTASAWTSYGTNTVSQDGAYVKVYVSDHAYGAYVPLSALGGLVSDMSTSKRYEITFTAYTDQSSGASIWANNTTPAVSKYLTTTPTTFSIAFGLTYYIPQLQFNGIGAGKSVWVKDISVKEIGVSAVTDRSYSSGASIKLSLDAIGLLTATAYDGTTTRTVTTTSAYNTGTWLKAEATYKAGKLAILVNGIEVAATYGTPLLTLNNSNAVLTIGNSYTLDAPFPGSLALLKLSATVPTIEQAQWMYSQEMELFRDNAQCLLPDANNILDLTYDDVYDSWMAVSSSNESRWTGLVRTGVTPVSAGTFSKVVSNSGIRAEARITTNPGVDITIPAYGLREELFKNAERFAATNQDITIFDYVGGFTATTSTTGAAAYTLTSVSGISYPAQCNLIGAVITGSGIPTGTTIVAISGTTIYIDKAATAAASGVQIALTDFPLPVGYETRAVLVAGALKSEGSTKDYTRLFDGFKETIRLNTAPAYNNNIQIQGVRLSQ